MIKRAIIAVTALALVVALAVPAFAQQDDVNQATNTQTGQSGTISQTALQCVEADEGNIEECLIEDEDNGNGEDNGDPDTIVDQANVGNEQNAAAVGGTGGDNNGTAVAVGDDLNGGDDNDNGDDNVVAINQQQQCQQSIASNQIENDAAVQDDTTLSNNNAGDVENFANVCQQSAAVAQQQNDDVNTATSAPVGQTGTIPQTAQQCVEADEGDIDECLIEDEDNGNGNGTTIADQANEGNEQNATATGGTGGDNNGAAVAVGGSGDDNVVAINQQQQCQQAIASNQIENDAAVQNDTTLSNNNAGDVENFANVCQQSAVVSQQQNDD